MRVTSLAVAACLLFAWVAHAGTLTLEVLDVGQGDAILIRTPANKVILVDAGDDPRRALELLKARDVDHIDLAVATHPHADHIGGMKAVVDAIPVKLFTDNGLVHSTGTYRSLMESVEARAVPYRAAVSGTVYRLDDGALLEVLFPSGKALRGTRSDLNSNSVVLRLKHQGHCFLLTGDAEEPTERAISSELGPCDVLKVAHHGSEHSSTAAFLSTVGARIALISVGRDNGYGHPGFETLERLRAANADVHRTDLEGTLVVRSSEKSLEVAAVKEALSVKASSPATFAGAPLQPGHDTAKEHSHQTVLGAAAPQGPCVFVASAKSEVFHESTCGNAKRIKPANVRCFPSREAATAAGRRPAGCCKP